MDYTEFPTRPCNTFEIGSLLKSKLGLQVNEPALYCAMPSIELQITDVHCNSVWQKIFCLP